MTRRMEIFVMVTFITPMVTVAFSIPELLSTLGKDYFYIMTAIALFILIMFWFASANSASNE